MNDNAFPSHWVSCCLGAVANVGGGLTKNAGKTDVPVRMPYLRVANVYSDELRLGQVEFINLSRAEAERYRLHRGDLLVVEGNGSIDQVGRVAMWGGQVDPCLHQNHLIRVRLGAGLSPRFALHWLLSPGGRRGVVQAASSTTGLHTLSISKVQGFLVPIPPLREQEHIVAALDSYLSRLDDAIANLGRVRRNLGRYRSSVLQAAVEGRLVPTEAELAKAEGRTFEPASVLLKRILAERRKRWEASGKKGKYEEPVGPDAAGLPELPEGWCWASVDEILAAPLANGRSVPDGVDGFPVLRLTAVRSGRIDLLACKSGAWTVAEAAPFLVEGGDFLVVRGNGSRHLVGRGGLVADDPSPVAFPDTLIRIRPAKDHLLPDYLCLLWDSGTVRRQVEKKAKTTAGIYKINQAELGSVVLPLPPLAEQQRVVQEVERLVSNAEAVANNVAAQLARCLRLRQSILKWAFEGKLVDQDPNDEPAGLTPGRSPADGHAAIRRHRAADSTVNAEGRS